MKYFSSSKYALAFLFVCFIVEYWLYAEFGLEKKEKSLQGLKDTARYILFMASVRQLAASHKETEFHSLYLSTFSLFPHYFLPSISIYYFLSSVLFFL